jgi:predicted transposase/invertase (TIGR01784 family)
MQYEESLKYYRDLKNSLDTAREEGKEEGRAEGRMEGIEEGKKNEKLEIAKKLRELGMSPGEIKKITGLSSRELEKHSGIHF